MDDSLTDMLTYIPLCLLYVTCKVVGEKLPYFHRLHWPHERQQYPLSGQ